MDEVAVGPSGGVVARTAECSTGSVDALAPHAARIVDVERPVDEHLGEQIRNRTAPHHGSFAVPAGGSDIQGEPDVPAPATGRVRRSRHCTLDMDPPALRCRIGALELKPALAVERNPYEGFSRLSRETRRKHLPKRAFGLG